MWRWCERVEGCGTVVKLVVAVRCKPPGTDLRLLQSLLFWQPLGYLGRYPIHLPLPHPITFSLFPRNISVYHKRKPRESGGMGVWEMENEVGGEERKLNMGVERRWLRSLQWMSVIGGIIPEIFSPMGWMLFTYPCIAFHGVVTSRI